uniref:Diguanylate cyclase n=1 Tax=candidate division WOR-3 bacterium TaxID=2052148 RepID=A0A7C4X8H7_UNCW3
MKDNDIIDRYIEKIDKLKEDSVLKKEDKDLSYIEKLIDLTCSFSRVENFTELLEAIVETAMSITKAERGFLMLFRKEGHLEFKVAKNINKETLESDDFSISRSIVNQVAETGQSIFLTDIYKEEKFKAQKSILELGLRMAMCVPLKVKGRLLGLIYVDSHSITETFTPLERKLFEAFAAQASILIENLELYETSIHDFLTGLYNYGFLNLRLDQEISRVIRYRKGTLSLMMIDIDNFKMINDTYGHFFGNALLTKVGEIIGKNVRKMDIPARYGGDEFAILMPETRAEDAVELAERLLRAVKSQPVEFEKKKISISLSIGISSFPAERILDSSGVIVEADHALYLSKQKGGNAVSVYACKGGEEITYENILVGVSKSLEEIKNSISTIAPTDANILISGETGTGKELVARLIHQRSLRKDKPFITVNCGAIPENLLESELFGYEKGAFTGAYMQHKGKFELANGGTIFFDEIGEMPLHLQVKILRAIENKEIDRIGGKSALKVDVRVIAATNKNLEEEMKKGNFREDLFYRLNVLHLHLSPLRERPEDIEPIASHFLSIFSKKYRKRIKGFTKRCIEAMVAHPWPGNVRQLIHAIERAVIMSEGEYITDGALGVAREEIESVESLKQFRENYEKKFIQRVLNRHRNNISKTAQELGISRKTLRDLIKRYQLV